MSTLRADVLTNNFRFEVEESLTIQNIQIKLDENCTLYNYLWTFNNQTTTSQSPQQVQFIQINQITATQQKQPTDFNLFGQIQFSANDINSFVIQNAHFENITQSNILISLVDVRQANLTNIQILNCTKVDSFFSSVRSSQINIINLQLDFISMKAINQLMILTAFSQLFLNQLNLPIDPYDGTEEQKFGSGNPLISLISGQSVLLNNSTVNMKNMEFSFASLIEIQQFTSTNTKFTNIYSNKNSNGGCLNFGNTNSVTLKLINTIFDHCVSSQFGGAIFGGVLTKVSNVIVTNCKSQVGGGLFLSNQSDILEILNIVFIDNKATFYEDNYLLGFKSISVDSIYEYNQNLGGTDFYYRQLRQYNNNTYIMYSGLLYIIYFNIEMNNLHKQLLNIPINLYSFCQLSTTLQQNFQQFEIPIMNNLPYMVLYQNPANFITNQKIILKFADSFPITQNFTIPANYCTTGMELIQLVNGEYMCKFCDTSKANYEASIYIDPNIKQKMTQNDKSDELILKYNEITINYVNQLKQIKYLQNQEQQNSNALNRFLQQTKPNIKNQIERQFYQNQENEFGIFNNQISQCISCNTNIFDMCYANYSNLKSGYWRSQYTVNDTYIYECAIQQDNCQGGNQTGNYLCTEGYIGPQCLDCDRRGIFWNASFGQSGTFQCNLCGNEKSNAAKIIVFISSFYLIITILIYSNFRSLRNILYSNYLSKMNIIFIGSSVQIQGETSVIIKTLMFNFSIYQVSNFISQKNLMDYLSFLSSNPLNSQFISLDCFLVDQLPSNYNIGFTKLILCILIPLIALVSIAIILFVCWLLKRVSLKMIFNIIIMTYTYLFVFSFYSITLELSLESIKCVQLQYNQSYLMIDLSLNCGDSDSNLTKIRVFGGIILIIFCFISPVILFLLYFLQRNKLNTVRVLLKFGFFYREYKKKFYFWEIIRQILKISIVSIKVLFIDQSVILVTLYSICLVVYLGIFFQCQPFISRQFNRLEAITIIVAIINILASSLLRQSKLNNSTQDSSLKFAQILYYISQAIQFTYFTYLIFLIIISFFSNKLKRLQKYRYFSCFSKYFPIYPHRLYLNFKKLREKVKSKCYVVALQSEFLPLKSNVQMQEITQNKFNDTIVLNNE